MNNPTNNSQIKTIFYLTALLLLYPVLLFLFPVTVLPLSNTINFVDLLNDKTLIVIITLFGITTYCTWQLRVFLGSLSTIQFIFIGSLIALPFIGIFPGDSDDFFTNFWYAERVIYLDEIPYQLEHYQDNYINHPTDLPGISPAPFLPYGPIWLGIQSVIYYLLGSLPIVVKVVLFKFFQLILWMCSLVVLDILVKLANPPVLATMRALTISPWILFAMIGNAHNDIWMFILIALSYLLLFYKRYVWGACVLLISVFFKYITLTLLPFYILYWLNNSSSTPKRTKQHISIFVLLAICSFALFELTLGISSGIFNQAGLSGYSMTYGLHLLFNTTGLPFIQQSVFPFIFLGLYLAILHTYWKSDKSYSGLLRASALVIASIFVFITQLWGYWYFVWILPCVIVFSKNIHRLLYILGTAHVILFFLLWYLFKLTDVSTITTKQMLLISPFLMTILTLSLLYFLVQLWKDRQVITE